MCKKGGRVDQQTFQQVFFEGLFPYIPDFGGDELVDEVGLFFDALQHTTRSNVVFFDGCDLEGTAADDGGEVVVVLFDAFVALSHLFSDGFFFFGVDGLFLDFGDVLDVFGLAFA